MAPRVAAPPGDHPDDIATLRAPWVYPLGGQYLLDPGEMNGWGVLGPGDDTNTQDLGNFDTNTPAHTAGGLVFPWDVRITRFFAWHRNSNNSAQAWGWVLFDQEKTAGANTDPTTFIINEVVDNGNVGPRDYGNNINQQTDMSLDYTLPAGHTLTLGVSSPTAVTTNYYVQIMSGYLLLERAT